MRRISDKDKITMEKGIKELEEEITCAICHNHYTEPKVLSCCHYYCKQCIHNLATRKGLDKPFSCPECRKDITLPEGSVDNLQAAFFIKRMQEVYSKLEQATGKVEGKCEMCLEDKAEAFCCQCTQFICLECKKAHERLRKAFEGHKLVTIDELKEIGPQYVVAQNPAPALCNLHKDPMKVYCFDCSTLICRDCTLKDHFQHNYEFITVAGPATKKKLIQHLKPLQISKLKVFSAVNEIQTTKSEVLAQADSLSSEIKTSFDHLHKILNRRKQELLKEVDKTACVKLKNLTKQEDTLGTAVTMAHSVIEFTEHSVNHSTDDYILCKYGELRSRIEKEVEEQPRSLEPVEEVDMAIEISCAEDISRICSTKALIGQLLTQCKVTVKEAEVGKLCEIFMVTKLPSGKPTKQECTIMCQLKSLVDDSVIQCKADLVKGNKYRMCYTPTTRGRHELAVTLNGHPLSESPFPMFVAMNPKKLDKPIRVIDSHIPRDVAVNSLGSIVILETGNISVIDKNGKTSSRQWSKYGLSDPWSLTVDRKDNSIYVAECKRDSCKIIKIRSDLELCESIVADKKIMGITVAGDDVLVGEGFRKIKVFTKALKHARYIKTNEFNSIFKISSDDNNMYVCDKTKSCIHVLNREKYEYLCSIGQHGSEGKKLNSPYACVCVADRYIYVVERHDHRVSVVHTDGNFVTSIGGKGSEKGQFIEPCGVCADQDGFIYVCDKDNKRIQVF